MASTTTDTTNNSSADTSDNVYETDSLVNMYLNLHFPSSDANDKVSPIIDKGVGFPQRVAQLLVSLKPEATRTALDIGCAVGGSSFELAKTFDKVDAFDFSKSFVDMAKRMRNEPEKVVFKVPVEADVHASIQAVHDEGVDKTVRDKTNFFTGDATKLKEMATDGQLTMYDGVVMSNLLCRLPDPMACLNGLQRIVNKGGVVVLVTPFSWLEEFTPRSQWLGGFYDPVTGEPIMSKDSLHEIMEERGFEKIHEEEMPLVIREHQRKYQFIVSEATAWRKL